MPEHARLLVVDAFTPRPFAGNPAAVVLPDPDRPFSPPDDLPAEVLQLLAREMNLSETAFPGLPDAEGVRRLRWFTPSTEVTLCGHATLAAAHALLEDGATEDVLHFHSASGALRVRPEGSTGDGPPALRLDFPADPPKEGPPPPGLLEALGVLPGARWAAGARCGVVEVTDEAQLQSMAPDMEALRRVPLPVGMLGVSVTVAPEAPGPDIRSRFFGPWVGVPEDPVTGMAHCVLGPWWMARLGGQREIRARQGFGRGFDRGGELQVRMVGTDRVHLVGEAVTVVRGEVVLPPEGP